MKKTMKRVLACALAAALSLGAAMTTLAATPSPTGGLIYSELPGSRVNQYICNPKSNGTVALIHAIPKDNKKIKVSDYIPVKGKKYKVIRIKAKAFVKCKQIKRISLPTELKLVEKMGFTGCTSLKELIIRGKKAFKIEKGAFKGLKTKSMTIFVNSKMKAKAYKKLQSNLRKAGFKGTIKKVKLKTA